MNIQLLDKSFTIFITQAEIQDKIKSIAEQINIDFAGKSPIFLPVLNGAFLFASDLAKHIKLTCEFEFVKISSYKGEISAKHQPFIMLGVEAATIQDKDVIVLEDIVDTGRTIEMLVHYLKQRNPKSIRVACLFHKQKLSPSIHLDYVGFEIPNDFIIGYGLDYANLGRNLMDVYKLEAK
ncbi:MAG: hypoxanthine phosphoribosyltransferase [Bacteroidia bacterium]|nr:hypoxanthine phosphoribosyltransferase [Bacteroidia bacterium]MDW8302871.1 hypoxanthine phosphoribosyltransferase [Bacteroidia bacterium]